jgi:hypothetical protein
MSDARRAGKRRAELYILIEVREDVWFYSGRHRTVNHYFGHSYVS